MPIRDCETGMHVIDREFGKKADPKFWVEVLKRISEESKLDYDAGVNSIASREAHVTPKLARRIREIFDNHFPNIEKELDKRLNSDEILNHISNYLFLQDKPLQEAIAIAGVDDKSSNEDNWKHRSEKMKCSTCMYYNPKKPKSPNADDYVGRCRRNAPTMNGWPVMFPTDWCGSHNLDENKI